MNKTAIRIKKLRGKLKMTQKELADKCGFHRQTISEFERGLRKGISLPMISKLVKLCRSNKINITSEYFID